MKNYFVAWAYSDGFGNCTFTDCIGPVTIERIRHWNDLIENNYHIRGVTIISWQEIAS